MHKFVLKRYVEKNVLWGALGLLNAPFAFMPLALTGALRLYETRRSHRGQVEDIAEIDHYTQLAKDSPLSRLCSEMGEKAGVQIRHVFMKGANGSFRNAMVVAEKESETSLFFEGDPLRDKILLKSGQNEAVLRGIIAHEIGHTKSSSDNTFRANSSLTTLLYGAVGALSPLCAMASVASGGVLMGAGLLGVSIAGFTGAFLTKALDNRFFRNEEYLADIRGAQIFGADDVVISHDYNRKILCQPPRVSHNKTPLSKADHFFALCDKVYGDTHPTPEQRISVLRDIFQTKAQFNPPPAEAIFPEAYLNNLNQLVGQQPR